MFEGLLQWLQRLPLTRLLWIFHSGQCYLQGVMIPQHGPSRDLKALYRWKLVPCQQWPSRSQPGSHSTPSCSQSSFPLPCFIFPCLFLFVFCLPEEECQHDHKLCVSHGQTPPRSKELSCANVYKKYSNSSVWNHPLVNIFLWLSIKIFMQTGPRSISSQNPVVKHSCILQQHSLKLTVTGQSCCCLGDRRILSCSCIVPLFLKSAAQSQWVMAH